MNKLFSGERGANPPTNVFDLSHDNKLSTKMGKLTPILCMECVPGDKISVKNNSFIRFAPMIAPVMHKINAFTHFFFVPNRILWDGWEEFITGGEDGNANRVFPTIAMDLSTFVSGTLYDYMGIPTKQDVGTGNTTVNVSAIPFAAYQLIFQEYYRDQNLQTLPSYMFTPLLDGANPASAYNQIRKRAWQHDYFTSALPWTQKGPEALLPLIGEAPIAMKTDIPLGPQSMMYGDDGSGVPLGDFGIANGSEIRSNADANRNLIYNLEDTHIADLSGATQTSIIDLRRAFKLQEWLEKNARGGSRYIESINVHFGVRSSDQRLQRPEYMGGMSQSVKISEVLQQTQNVAADPALAPPLGSMGGHAVSVGSGEYASHFCEEHGYIIGIQSVLPNTSYQQGIPKHFLKKDKFDFYWPEFAHIGEQPIENQELYVGGDFQENDGTFGYTPRYAEYKFMQNNVHGDFKSELDFWHMGRKFASDPVLGAGFIEMDSADLDQRIFAVGGQTGEAEVPDNLWIHNLINITAKRPMAIYGTPKF